MEPLPVVAVAVGQEMGIGTGRVDSCGEGLGVCGVGGKGRDVLPCCGVLSWMGLRTLPILILTEVMAGGPVWVVWDDGDWPALEWMQVWSLGEDGVDDWSLWRMVVWLWVA